jgi:undecaprenyl-diphosphatase
MRVITWLGSPVWLNIVFAVACVALFLFRAWRSLLFLVLASPGAVLMVQLVKHLVERHRPSGLHLVHAGGASWPSGHASSSAALYGALFLIVVRSGALGTRAHRRVAALAVGALLALIGFSRVYLAVHYPTDVVAAWLLVAGWLNAVRYADQRW